MLRKICPVISLLFIAMICFAGSLHKTNPIILKFNLAKGSRFSYALKMNMVINQNMNGQEIKVENTIGFGYFFEVTKDSSGWKTLSTTISGISMQINAGGQIMKFDTDSAITDSTSPSAMLAKIMGAFKGGQFSFTMDEKGHVGEVHGMKEMVKNAIRKTNSPNSEMMMENMGKSFDEASFKQNIEQSFAAYPEKPVSPGDTWNRTATITSNGLPIKYESAYTLVSVTGNIANVKVSSKLSSGAGTNANADGAKELDGTMNGLTNYDILTGIPLNGDITTKMNMKVNVQGHEMPVKMDMKTNISGKKL